MKVVEPAVKPIKAWADGVEFDENARKQIENVASVGAIVPAAFGVDIGCFDGNTKIPLLDGTQATLSDLAECTGPFWVYSIDKNLQIVPGRAVARRTRTNAELMRVVVSGGSEIICTPDHLFMQSDGTYRQAADLSFNDSLMPLYRSWQKRDGYESVSCGKGTSRQTHEMVWEHFNGKVPPGHVVHHKNIIQFDNRPENLMIMTAGAHSAYHRSVGKSFKNECPIFQSRRLAGIARRKANPAKAAAMKAVATANITKYMLEHPDHFRMSTAGNGKRGAQFLINFNMSPRPCDVCDHVAVNPAALRWQKSRAHQQNHKVLRIETIDRRGKGYCLQVEEHQNFALAAGVFVHNCG